MAHRGRVAGADMACVRAAYGALLGAAREMLDDGSFTFAGRGVPFAAINAAFRALDGSA